MVLVELIQAHRVTAMEDMEPLQRRLLQSLLAQPTMSMWVVREQSMLLVSMVEGVWAFLVAALVAVVPQMFALR